jgi:hypothetical protein
VQTSRPLWPYTGLGEEASRVFCLAFLFLREACPHSFKLKLDTRDDTCTLASMVFAHSRECSGIQIAVEYFATTPTALCLANQLSKSFEPKARKAAVRQQKRDVRLFLFFASALFCAFSAV